MKNRALGTVRTHYAALWIYDWISYWREYPNQYDREIMVLNVKELIK